MDKRLMLALGVTSIWGSAESVYALAEQDRLVEERQHVRVKPSLSTTKAKRDINARLKLSINLKGGKSPSSLQSLKNKKLERKQARAARKKLSLALNASKKKALSSLIQAKKKARLVAKRNRKAAARIKRIERQRLQFRKKWERQEARLQAKKSRVLRKNPAALNRQKLQEQIALNRLKKPITNSKKVESVRNIGSRTPVLPLGLKAPNLAKKVISPVQKVSAPIGKLPSKETLASSSLLRVKGLPFVRLEDNSRKQPIASLLKTIAAKKTEEMQARFKAANDSSEQSVLRERPLGGNISLVRNDQPTPLSFLYLKEQMDAEMHVGVVSNDTKVDENINHVPNHPVLENLERELNSENPIPVLRRLPLEGSISLESNDQSNPLTLLSLGEHRTAEMHVGAVNNDTEVDENINHVPNHPVSKDLTLEDLELNSENLAPVLRGLTGKIWDFVENASKDVSATSFRSLEALREITTFTDVVNQIAQQLNPSISHENGLVREGGYDWETLDDDQTLYGQTLTKEGEDLKKDWGNTDDDLKKDKTYVPFVDEKFDRDMEVYTAKFESLEKAISQFQYASFHLRNRVETDDSDNIEEKKADLRKQLAVAFTIESTLSSLKLLDSESDAESINSILKGHEESVSAEKLRLSMALKSLLELEAKSNAASSLSQPTQTDDEKEKNVGSDTSLTTSLPVIQGENELQTGTSTLDQKDLEPENKSSLTSKSTATDSEELSTRPFPSILGSLNTLLDGLVDRVGLNSDVASGYFTMKLYSNWIKEKLVSIETGEESKSSSSIVSKQEEDYDFAADMKDLRSKVSHYLTLSSPSNANDWLLNFKINGGKSAAVKLIEELTRLNKELEEKDQKAKDSIPTVQSSAPSQQQPSATTVQSSAPSQQQPAVAVGNAGFSLWDYVPSNPFSAAKPPVTPSQQATSNGDSGNPPQDPSNGSGSNSSNNNDKD